MPNSHEKSDPEIDVASLTKKQIAALEEDPFLQFLVEKKARRASWEFLAAVLVLVGGVVTYVGLEWKDKRMEMERKFEKTLADAEKELDQAKSVVVHVNQARESLDLRTKIFEELLQARMTALDRISQRIESENQYAQRMIGDGLRTIETAKTKSESAVTKAETVSNSVDQKMKQLEIEVGRATADNESRENKTKMLSQTVAQILRQKSSELIVLRERQSYQVFLPNPLDKSGEDKAVLMQFSIGSISKKFQINWEVITPIKEGRRQGTVEVEKTRLGASLLTESAKPLEGTPFEIVISYVDSGVIAHDFVIFKVRPIESALIEPSSPTVSRL